MAALFVQIVRNPSGSTAVEYGLLCAFCAIAVAAAAAALSSGLDAGFSGLAADITTLP